MPDALKRTDLEKIVTQSVFVRGANVAFAAMGAVVSLPAVFLAGGMTGADPCSQVSGLNQQHHKQRKSDIPNHGGGSCPFNRRLSPRDAQSGRCVCVCVCDSKRAAGMGRCMLSLIAQNTGTGATMLLQPLAKEDALPPPFF